MALIWRLYNIKHPTLINNSNTYKNNNPWDKIILNSFYQPYSNNYFHLHNEETSNNLTQILGEPIKKITIPLKDDNNIPNGNIQPQMKTLHCIRLSKKHWRMAIPSH